MSLRILVTYLPDDKLTDVPTIEIDTDGFICVYGYDLNPRLSAMLNSLAFCLADFYDELKMEKDKC